IYMQGMDAVDATRAGIAYLTRKVQGRGGVIVIDREGRCSTGFTTKKMIHGWIEHGGKAMVRF
ncbi:MAG: isoaspartyl peptidase/L-asparaginase, partial [Gammaproteobacteria bacterium]